MSERQSHFFVCLFCIVGSFFFFSFGTRNQSGIYPFWIRLAVNVDQEPVCHFPDTVGHCMEQPKACRE